MRGPRQDLLVGLAGLAFGAGVGAATGAQDALVGGALGVALAGSRRRPGTTLLAANAILVAAILSGVLPGEDPISPYFLIGAHCVLAGRYAGGWMAVAGPAVLLVLASVASWTDSGPFVGFICVAAWAGGRALREREEVTARLAERARELDEEREAHAELSVRYERARIASELHDIVAHAISVMVVQATAGQRLVGTAPELAAETFENLASAARQAEADLGRLVALLGDEDAIGAAPDLSLVEELVRHAAGSGLDVTLRLEGQREGLPAEVAQTAYRVVQEGLTNALRYAAGSAVAVVVRGDHDALEVSVENGPAGGGAGLGGVGTGNGLRGVRERVGACAGSVDAGPTAGGGWRLAVRLPRRETVGPTGTPAPSPSA